MTNKTFNLDKDVWQTFKVRCTKEGRTIKEVLTELISWYSKSGIVNSSTSNYSTPKKKCNDAGADALNLLATENAIQKEGDTNEEEN